MVLKFWKLLIKESTLFFLCVAFLPTQLGRHFFFDFSYVYSLRIDYLAGIIYFWDILVFFLIFKWLRNGGKVSDLALRIFLFFVLSQAVSILFSRNSGAGLVRLEQFLVIGGFGVYIASKTLVEIRVNLLKGLLTGIIFEGFLAVCQFLFGRSIGFWIFGERDFSLATHLIATFNWYGQVFLRPYGTFSHPNVLSAFIVICLPVTIYLYFDARRSRIISRMLGIALSVGILSAVLTFSRGSLLVLGVESLISLKRRVKLFLMASLLILPFVFVRFDSAFNFDYLSISRREELAEIAFTQFLSHPFFGVGLNNFISETASSNLVSGQNRFLQPVHNIFLLALSESGLIGLTGLIGLIGVSIFRLWKNREYPKAKLMLGLWGVILFLGMFDHYFLTIAQGQRLLFLIWGLSMQDIES